MKKKFYTVIVPI